MRRIGSAIRGEKKSRTKKVKGGTLMPLAKGVGIATAVEDGDIGPENAQLRERVKIKANKRDSSPRDTSLKASRKVSSLKDSRDTSLKATNLKVLGERDINRQEKDINRQARDIKDHVGHAAK